MSLSLKHALSTLLFVAVPFSAQAVELQNQQQKFSYTLGFQFGQQMKKDGIKVDAAAFAAAIDDVLQGKPLQMSLDEMRTALKTGREQMIKEKQQKAEAALEAGKQFLAENAKKPGVKSLPSGLQYTELKAGEGESPKPESTVTVHYRGTLINGKEFDSSYKRGEPTSFKLNSVIPGFREALTHMKPGAKWKIFVPSEMGYGEKGAGGSIGPNETLIFEIELLSYK
jgi:FKBP-type peptidyl-prolyl cis-trans isomerase